MAKITNTSDDVQRPSLRPRSSLEAAGLLISDDAAWKKWPLTDSAKTCGRVRTLGINTKTGNLWYVPVSCRSYGHRPCAERLVKGYLRTIYANLDGRTSGYTTVMDEADFDPARLKHRLSDFRASRHDDRFDWYRAVRRTDGSVTVVSMVQLGGRLPPVSMEPVDDLLAAAAQALRLPGVVRFTGTRWERQPDEDTDGGGLSLVLGRMFEDEREAFLEEVAAEVLRRHGVKIDSAHPLVYPRHITVSQYVACADRVLARTR
jgi:hypothetical protein